METTMIGEHARSTDPMLELIDQILQLVKCVSAVHELEANRHHQLS